MTEIARMLNESTADKNNVAKRIPPVGFPSTPNDELHSSLKIHPTKTRIKDTPHGFVTTSLIMILVIMIFSWD